VLFDGDRAVGVKVDFGDGDKDVAAKVVVDASGQAAIISKKLGLRQPDPELKKAAFFSHFEGALRDPGIDEGATLVIHNNDASAWFWYIPLPNDRVSVGVVGSPEALIAGRERDPQKIFDEQVAKTPAIQPRIPNARQAFPVRALREFSYRSSRIAGDGWVLAGDAFGFLDPIYSSGVFLALKSGELAADSVHEALVSGDLSGEKLGAHGPGFMAGMEAMRKLVYAFYEQGFSFAKFLARHPEHRLDIVHLLVGNVSVPTSGLFSAMSTMARLPEEVKLDPSPAGAAH